jgi:hypothetical protein
MKDASTTHKVILIVILVVAAGAYAYFGLWPQLKPSKE